MPKDYDHKKIETHWQKFWADNDAFKTGTGDSNKEKYYVLEMFPYPSGRIHMGHVRNYSIGDIIARFQALQGKEVLHPMGWDSFGLPAENAAIDRGTQPKKWTYENIDNMRGQIKKLGMNYDWDREIATSNPDYYKWSQWLFLKLFEKGLAYKKKASVNWCDDCVTVLANEQVEDGKCWRCSTEVTVKELNQWFFKITDYAEELLEGTDKLTGWPDRVTTMQKHWIGKSVGAEVSFKVDGATHVVDIFTTRPDTLYGTTFMSLAPEHPLVKEITTGENKKSVEDFVNKFKSTTLRDIEEGGLPKEGVFTGAYCINPLTDLKIPVYVANFVLMGYGTGAVMAVPGHDDRDFEFAKKYDIDIKVVINPKDSDALDSATMETAFTEAGVMVNSGDFDGMDSLEGKKAVIKHLESLGIGKGTTTYRIKDWGISRQRYWGCPIPIINCDKCGTVRVPDSDLPVELPDTVDFKSGGVSPLENVEDFVNCKCPKCGTDAKRETDTMDTFVDSSWYYLRYISPKSGKLPFDKDDANRWMSVDQYIGGIEHAVMHLLYARFFTKALRDLGLVDVDEPFKNLLTQGMVCMETYKCPNDDWLYPEEVKDGKCIKCGSVVTVGDVIKMSKSKKNVVDPDHIIEKYGADTTRLFSLFAAPPERDLDWNENGVEGCYRFLSRLWRFVDDNITDLKSVEPYKGGSELEGFLKDLRKKTHETINKVTGDVGTRFHFNTAISAVMELLNMMYRYKIDFDGDAALGYSVLRESVEAVLVMLNPFTPHITEELWKDLGCDGYLYNSKWLKADESALSTNAMDLIVQVNGKLRGKISIAVDGDKDAAEQAAKDDEKISTWLEGKEIRKVIFVPGKLLNIVVSG